MNEQEQARNQGVMTSNMEYSNFNALQLRLNTDPVLRQIESYLKGQIITTEIDTSSGMMFEKTRDVGIPLANEEGIQAIMSLLTALFNTQVVQGNFEDHAEYEDFLIRTRKDLADELIINRNKYGISREKLSAIISKIMRIVEVYMTRPIKNKERESYAATMKTFESNTVNASGNQKKGWFPW
jgi:hypothetical protein